MAQPLDVLETCLCAPDLDAVRPFYRDVLGLEEIAHQPGRHLFFRCGRGVLLLFCAEHTATQQTEVNGSLLPLHGTHGAGHVAFRVDAGELDVWQRQLPASGVAIESIVDWPNGARSIYFRDPAGNSLEFATPNLWT
jgi:catechol 2,3-dioxygenase-like lactoylglutathione lyase family enzyme